MTVRTATQLANISMLIDHYSRRTGLSCWSYSQCASAVLKYRGVITDKFSDAQIAQALGITPDEAIDVVTGPARWERLDDIALRDAVVAMLDHLLDTGKVHWAGDLAA